MKSAFWLLAAVGCASSALAQTPANVVQEPAAAAAAAMSPAMAARYADALAIAQATNTRESSLAELSRLFTPAGVASFARAPGFAELEAKYPGIARYALDAARPELEAQVVRSLPNLHSAIATLFASEMNAVELKGAKAYYLSAPGQRLLAAARANLDGASLINSMNARGNGDVTAADLDKTIRSSVPAVVKAMSQADRDALLRFMKTPAFAAMARLKPRAQAVIASYSNTSEPEDQKKISDLMADAVQRFIKNAEPRK